MGNFMLRNTILTLTLIFGCALSPAAYGQSDATLAHIETSDFAVFTPKTQSLNTRIEYDYWDTALDGIVLNLGKSVRRSAMRPKTNLGTRRVVGHTSRYRLEGSRVIFSFLKPEQIDEMARYRAYLVSVANKYDLQSFSRDEQLAFWFNLHNILLIETVAKNYPVKHPSKIQIKGVPLHDAKLITINGVPLSLQNIREDIVYKNWASADVIYGFFLGEIGGPALMNYAFTGDNVNDVTNDLAQEFATSMRGFQTTLTARKVSKLYEDVRPFYFTNWPADLENHLGKYADEKLVAGISQNKPLNIAKYETAIADIMGGAKPRESISQISNILGWTSTGAPIQTHLQPKSSSIQMDRFLAEYDAKINTMRNRGMLPKHGTVTISDPTPVNVDEEQSEK
jgi:Protein of unknown function, DUF547